MKISVITLCHNEETILPFFIRHYEPWVDEMVFFDGLSTDRSRDIIAACSIAQIVDHDTHGEVDDADNVRIKNTAYKTMDADWFVVVDADELVYHPCPREYLEDCDRRGVNLVCCEGWNMIGDQIPAGGRLTDAIPWGVRDELAEKEYDKAAVFKPEVDIRFEPGCHACAPRHARPDSYKSMKLLHYKWLSLDYVQGKARNLKLSAANVLNNWGHTKDGQPNNTLWVDYYLQARERRVRVI